MFLSLLGFIENKKGSDEHSITTGMRSCEYRPTVYHSCREGKPKAISELKWRVSLVAQMVKNLPATWETWARKIPWRREWQPTLVFLPGRSHGQGVVGYSPRGGRVGHD